MTSAARDSLASAGAPKPEAMATARVNTSSSESETESDDSSVFVNENLFFADSEDNVESPRTAVQTNVQSYRFEPMKKALSVP